MGANSFVLRTQGKSAKAAFQEAVEDARAVHGSDGYTGTIAEKGSYRTVTVPDGMDPEDYVQELLDGSSWVVDKYGPCACIDLGGDEYLFFGFAAS